MKKIIALILSAPLLVCTAACSVFGGGAQIPNPWHEFEKLADAEAYAGYEFGAATTAAAYQAARFSVMDHENPLIQVDYKIDSKEVTVRKQAGEGRDISGVYGLNTAETLSFGDVAVTSRSGNGSAALLCFDYSGYSWSIYAPEGFDGAADAFLGAVIRK